jgi:hypothetical protein
MAPYQSLVQNGRLKTHRKKVHFGSFWPGLKFGGFKWPLVAFGTLRSFLMFFHFCQYARPQHLAPAQPRSLTNHTPAYAHFFADGSTSLAKLSKGFSKLFKPKNESATATRPTQRSRGPVLHNSSFIL